MAWLTVHEFVQPHIEAAGPFPVAGTVAWQLLPATEPGKWAALLDAAQHYALRLDIEQEAAIAAGQAISRSQDWGSVARKMRQRHDFYEQRPWLRRKEVA
ncbi:phiRv2 phage protein [Mycobacteroides abscessus M94]|nr:phiRv2 phage protein [Mycobacteroides abscessus M94]